ncbi:hypothetical protein [Rhodococcus sp. Q]|uniref:hypothetical protein n=1 Tax=Rhodococcus sp. Q TaxID=2502252 RepID=UPI0010F6E353|nr:hypothetical protein [Rhodococcus sp. Q]
MSSFLKDQAGDEEFRIRQGLDKVDLFFELNLDEDELRRAQELFGRLVHQSRRAGTHTTLIGRYPALTLAALVGHAGLAYEQGRYWESFWDELDLERDQDFENALRHSLVDLLRKFDLREFSELGGRSYVMVMAMHAGIPVHCLGDLVDLIEEHVQHGRDATGAALLEWLTEPGMDYRFGQLDVPVRNFIRHGGDVAADILNRIFEFLVFTLEHPAVWNDLDLDSAATRLPTLLLNGLIDRLEERSFLSGVDVAVATRTVRRRRSPAVIYSVQDDEVLVGVPYPDGCEHSPWKVSMGGTTREVYAERGWGVEDGEHPHTPVTVTSPAREVTMVHEDSGTHHRVAVFDSADPLLLFTLDGNLVSRTSQLPRGLVLALHPGDAHVVDAVSGEPLASADHPRVPSGWTGWRADTLDLARHDAIVIRRPGRADGVIRGVRSIGAPKFILPEPVPGLFTTNGLSVYGELPTVELPPHIGSEAQNWSVRARRIGDRDWLVDDVWMSETDTTSVEPFDGVTDVLLGQYEILVGGPVGSDQRLALFVADGIGLDHSVQFRKPVTGGLTPSTTTVTTEYDLDVDHDTLAFVPTDREREIRVGTGSHAYKLVVRPPYVETRIDVVGTPTQWRSTAQSVSPADLEAHAVVAVRVPGNPAVSFVLVDGNDRPVQQENPEHPSGNVFQLSTRRFVDTARRVGTCRLVAVVHDASGDVHRIALADVRPARLCENVHLDGADLVFTALADIDDPAAWVWTATAPWRPLVRVGITGGRATLPDELCAAGDLVVQVFADDPFSIITRPERPDRDAIRVAQPGWVRDDVEALDHLAQFLSGHTVQPPLTPEATAGAWSALALLRWDRDDAGSERIRGGLVRILGRNPRSALEALGASVISQDAMIALLIRTHLVDRPYSAGYTLNDLHPNPWIGCMIEISDLPSLLDRGAEVEHERAETLAYLTTQGGTELINLLRSGKMVDPTSGVLNHEAPMFDAMDPEQVEQIFAHARLVPGALLDLDTRTSAIFDVFNRRHDWTADSACRGLPGHVNRALREVKRVSPALYDLVEARNEVLHGVDPVKYPWLLLSVQSLTLAAVARLDARGEFDHSPMTADMREEWATLAEYFPEMVAGDLLIAEALAAHLSHGDLIGETA